MAQWPNGYQDFELKVAKDSPDTVLLHATGYKKFGPEAALGSVVAHWGVYYRAAIAQVLDGKWKNDPVWWGLPQQAVDLEDLNSGQY